MTVLEKAFTPNHKNYRDNSIIVFLLHAIFLLVPGIILGHMIDRAIWYLKKNKKFGTFNLIYIILQVLLNVIVLYIIYEISFIYAQELQTTLSGIFFVALFFNMQIHFLINLQELLHINNVND